MNSIFKQTLRSEMEFQDIRVKELAAKTGISPRTLEGYLGTRSSIPPADVAVKIASALNVSVEYLVTGKNSKIHSSSSILENADDNSSGKKILLKEISSLLDDFLVEKKGQADKSNSR